MTDFCASVCLRLACLQADNPNNPFHKFFVGQITRDSRRETLLAWAAHEDDFQQTMEVVKRRFEVNVSKVSGARGKMYTEVELRRKLGDTVANTLMANCVQLSTKYPELVNQDHMLGTNTYMLCKKLLSQLTTEVSSQVTELTPTGSTFEAPMTPLMLENGTKPVPASATPEPSGGGVLDSASSSNSSTDVGSCEAPPEGASDQDSGVQRYIKQLHVLITAMPEGVPASLRSLLLAAEAIAT